MDIERIEVVVSNLAEEGIAVAKDTLDLESVEAGSPGRLALEDIVLLVD